VVGAQQAGQAPVAPPPASTPGTAAPASSQRSPASPATVPAAQQAPTAGAAGAKAQAASKRQSFEGRFKTAVLAGDSLNELIVPVEPRLVDRLPREVKIAWPQSRCDASSSGLQVRSMSTIANDQTKTVFVVHVPAPPCRWPIAQPAAITIQGELVDPPGVHTLFDQIVPVSVLWVPAALTLLAIATIYPGCAITVWLMRRYQFRRGARPDRPTFLSSLDPVQITANPYGRASLAKLQIFLFSMIVFGLLLFFQLRTSTLPALSTDIMLLMGISAVGATGGKITHVAKRRLRFDNWTWLRRKGWLPEKGEVAPRARWSELFLDGDTKEFDPYSFQMAVFSFVVAVALVRTSLSDFGSFKIPNELLALLGLSQVVFIGGKAVEKSAYNELDAKLDDVRAKEEAVRVAARTVPNDPAMQTARDALKADLIAAAEGFVATFREQLPPDTPLDVEQLVAKAAKDVP
jgi:hypothetical protein